VPESAALAIVIVSYNVRDELDACLRSIVGRTAPLAASITVVDNGSTDGTLAMLRERWDSIRVIEAGSNLGFARGNNVGIRATPGDYVLLLNPDTEVLEGTIERVLAFAADNPKAGVIGCRVRYPNGTQQSTFFRYLRLRTVLLNLFVPNRWMRRSEWLGHSRYIGADPDTIQNVEVIAGCFMLVPRAAIEQVGGMDEGYFMYGEEADWCYRMRRAGWSAQYYPDATILHHGGQSARQTPGPMLRAMARSQLRFLEKTQGRAAAYAANALMLLRDLPRSLLWQVLGLLPSGHSSKLALRLEPSVHRVPLHLRGLLGRRWAAPGAGAPEP
jgi:GT2 family glycosyltransferase